jgi:SAM-dependent methyltransferase
MADQRRMAMDAKKHWESVYDVKAPDAVSWYAPHLRTSLGYIKRTGLPVESRVIDVGGGEATLVDDLLDAGYQAVSVLDLSQKAIDVTRGRLGQRARNVDWIVADVLSHEFAARSVDVWHDRAVFHFLTSETDRKRYVQQVTRALRPGGFAVVGTFGLEGPTQCSGLPVARYDSEGLHGEFGARFRLVDSTQDMHTTPWGTPQQFVYCFCRLDH